MRGRAAEIADAGTFSWEVVWEALKTEPPDESSSAITQELGLGEEQDLSQGGDLPATQFSGTRNGRRVELRLGVVPAALGKKGVNEVHVEAPVAPFRASADDDRLVAESGSVPEVEEFLAGLAPGAAWRKATRRGRARRDPRPPARDRPSAGLRVRPLAGGAPRRPARRLASGAAPELRWQRLRSVGIELGELLIGHLERVRRLRRGADDEPQGIGLGVVEDLPSVSGSTESADSGSRVTTSSSTRIRPVPSSTT